MKRISLDELIERQSSESYARQYDYVLGLLESGKLKPVKNAGTNGKKPALCLSYWIQEEPGGGCRDLEEELKFRLSPLISTAYYLSHLKEYQKDREWVLMLDAYLTSNQDLLQQPESVNERSFEIWNREKFLTKEQGARILKRCGLQPDFLNMYPTAEPISYYTHTRRTPQTMLILENKDTFFSMRRFLLDGNEKIFGEEIGTLIYGGGKRIIKSFQDFEISVEPYMRSEDNQIYYFGDLDYEGIGIYENLAKLCQEHQEIIPFQPAYQAMLEKAAGVKALPDTKERQNRNIGHLFFDWFPEETVSRMKQILSEGKYIPQEILNILDFM